MDRRTIRPERDISKVGIREFSLQTNRKFIDCHDKDIRGKRAALANTSSRGKGSRRLTIYKDRKGNSGNTGSNEVNEIVGKTKAVESRGNEIPSQPIKSFGKINFKKESLLVPRL